ncbi:tetratricopeptide repeat protein, partial [bacterium]|nr:tetratricopeptide repeat protein [bacterium]
MEKDYDKALGFHEQALSIHLKILNQDHPEIALDYHNLGYIYYDKGDYANAREAYERAISINRKSYGEQHMSLAQNYTELSKVYLEQSNYESALEYAQKAQLISLKIFGNRHVDVATNYHEISRIYHRKKNYRKALEFQNESLSIRNELFGEKHPHVAASYQELGDIKSNENDHHAALAYYQQSIISLVQSFNDSDIYANPKLENISDRQALLKSLELKAETFYHLYSAQLNNLKDLEASFAACRLADELIAKMRMEYSTEGSKLALGAQAAKIYNKAIRTALKLYEISKDEKYKEAAFEFAEKNKAGVLYDALSSVRAKQFAGIPDSLL